MHEKIRQERLNKLMGTVGAAVSHMEKALATLEDANYYTNDDQEHQVDVLVTRLTDLIKDTRHYLP